MTRQDVNQALLQTSFLYGANSAYIEALQAKYEKDPMSVEPGWRDFFESARGRPGERDQDGERRVVEEAELAADAEGRSDQRARRRLAGDGKGARRQDPRQGRRGRSGRAGQRRRDPARHPRLGARDHDDPRLPHARPPARQPRSARPRAAEGPRGAASGDLRLRRGRLRPQDLHRPRARPRIRHRARDAGDPAAHLLRHDRLRVPPHLRPGREGLDPGAHRGTGQGDPLHPRRQARHPVEAGRGGRLRELLRHQVHRRQALRPRRRRGDDPGARADHQARRPTRLARNLRRHGPPRPPQRAVAGDGQAAPRHLPRVQGRLGRARRGRRLGRRQVPSRRLVGPRVRRQHRASVADRQPLAPRDRRSGGARQGARQAGPARRRHRALEGAAASHPRRRGLRRPGRGGGMLRPLGPARPPHRRLAPLHHQQPDRLHHLSALFALLALPVGRGQAGRGADLPRQRRRSGSGGVLRQGGDRVPAEVPQAGRHRHVLLPAVRPQRGRRAVVHPADHVPADPLAPDHAADLCRQADRRGSRHPGRGRQDARRLAPSARGGIRGGPGLCAQQGGLARRPLGRLQGVAGRGRGRPPRRHRLRRRPAEADRRAHHHGAAGLRDPQDHPSLPRQPPQRDRQRRGHRLGDRRSARLRRAARRGLSRCASAARTPSAARSRSAIRC